MARQNAALVTFNRGLIDPRALARVDLQRTALSAEIQTNWMPRVLGSMMLRPGFGLTPDGATITIGKPKYIPFVFAPDDMALIELRYAQEFSVLIDGEYVRVPAVSTTIANTNFGVDLSSWTDADDTGAISQWSPLDGGKMQLTGSAFTSARRRQELTIAVSDQGVKHYLNIGVSAGPIQMRVGTTAGAQDVLSEITLSTGNHAIAVIPQTASVWLEFAKLGTGSSFLSYAQIKAADILHVAVPWAESDYPYLRFDQSGDVIYVACKGKQQYKIERRRDQSWSVVKYEPSDGPFKVINVKPITITPGAVFGDTTLAASSDIFHSGHVGSLFRLDSIGQTVSDTLTGGSQFTNAIRVTGIEDSRKFSITRSGTWSATLTLQRSVGDIGAWEDVATYTGNGTTTYDDGFDNQVIYYRIGISAGDYTSGTANVSLVYAIGSITGIARVTAFTDARNVNVTVLQDFGSTTPTELWYEGEWSSYRGWPSAVALYDGRLFWAGKDRNWGSVSDAYESFDDTIEGDSAPISRSIGMGPVDTINWILPLQRLILGGLGAEYSVRSSSLDEPLTPTNYNIKKCSTQGSFNITPTIVDSAGMYVQRGGTRLFELAFGSEVYDYQSREMTLLVPSLCDPGIVSVAVQRQPDTRVHCVLGDGTAAVLIYDALEDVRGWVKIESAAKIVDVVTLPGGDEDLVYYVLTFDDLHHFLVQWAQEDECQGGQLNKQADLFVEYSGVPISTLTGLDHLEGRTVVVWADGKDIGERTVLGGQIVLGASYSNIVAGLGYEARYKSVKLAYAAVGGTALNQTKTVSHLGLILNNTHKAGLQFGPDFDTLDDLPGTEDSAVVPDDMIWDFYDKDMIEFPGSYNTDSRFVLLAKAPRPVTVLGCTITVQTNEK